jgi:hypothetical protein
LLGIASLDTVCQMCQVMTSRLFGGRNAAIKNGLLSDGDRHVAARSVVFESCSKLQLNDNQINEDVAYVPVRNYSTRDTQ